MIIIFFLDQYTKNFFNSKLQFQVPTEVYSNFDLYLTYNYGVAFSFLSDNENWQKTVKYGGNKRHISHENKLSSKLSSKSSKLQK